MRYYGGDSAKPLPARIGDWATATFVTYWNGDSHVNTRLEWSLHRVLGCSRLPRTRVCLASLAVLLAGLLGTRAADLEPPSSAAAPVVGSGWTVPDLGMAFVWVPALKAWVAKYEVTNAEYWTFKPEHKSGDYNGTSLSRDRQPVVQVNLDEAKAYAAWLTERERGRKRLPPGLRYRLPTGSEWSAVARCGTRRAFPWGKGWPPRRGNYADETAKDRFGLSSIPRYDDGSAVSCEVHLTKANTWGICGIGGNVWEWTSSEDGGHDALRGGSWFSYSKSVLRYDSRLGGGPWRRGNAAGFRLVLAH